MIVAVGIASIAAFMIAFHLMRLPAVASKIIMTARAATKTVMDPALDDLAKEKATQTAALHMLGGTGSLLIRIAIVLAIAFAPIWLASVAALAPLHDVIAFMERWEVILAATVIITFGYVLWSRPWHRR